MNQQHIALAPHRLVLSAQIDILPTSRKRKASGHQFGDFHERLLDRRKAARSEEARIVSGSRKSPQTKPAIIGSAAQTGCALL